MELYRSTLTEYIYTYEFRVYDWKTRKYVDVARPVVCSVMVLENHYMFIDNKTYWISYCLSIGDNNILSFPISEIGNNFEFYSKTVQINSTGKLQGIISFGDLR